jgi:hypothetical protein
MQVGQWMRFRRGDDSLRWLAVALQMLVLLGGAATLINLGLFRNSVLAEAHRQMAGLAATLAQHMQAPFDAELEASRLAPLRSGLGGDAVVAVFGRDGALLLSLPAAGATPPPPGCTRPRHPTSEVSRRRGRRTASNASGATPPWKAATRPCWWAFRGRRSPPGSSNWPGTWPR